jgi:hypothetical protein
VLTDAVTRLAAAWREALAAPFDPHRADRGTTALVS